VSGDVWRLTNWLTGNLAFALPCHRVFCSDAAVSIIFFLGFSVQRMQTSPCIEKRKESPVPDLDPGFCWPKIEKIQLKKSYGIFFDQKLQFSYP
jgi:hypothetical protein